MKYWWLEKYKDFKILQIVDLKTDINYFLTMPKNYEKKYLEIKDKDIESLEEEDLLILLKKIVNSKNLKDNKLILIIKKLLTIPDNSFPASDYNLNEMLEEIEKLYRNFPTKDKLDHNNIAICYHCKNIFYIDKIKNVNKMNICLCPFCNSNKMYFDNDYIPMNYTFIKLAYLYYHISSLGCSFIELQKILKKNVKVELIEEIDKENIIDLTEIFTEKLTPINEKILSKQIYDKLNHKNNLLERNIVIYIDDIKMNSTNKLILLVVNIIEVLSETLYLRNITVKTKSKKVNDYLKSLLKTIIKFKIK